jgi:glycopeptide antibiotics resistance protein
MKISYITVLTIFLIHTHVCLLMNLPIQWYLLSRDIIPFQSMGRFSFVMSQGSLGFNMFLKRYYMYINTK